MTDLLKAALSYLKNQDQSLSVEQRVLLAFGAGAVFGSDTVTATVKTKAVLFKMENAK